nr:hypothetical protein [uncultured Anaerostipes sp.]
MEERIGKKVFGGIAIGKIKFHSKSENRVIRRNVEAAEAEVERYEAARRRYIISCTCQGAGQN